MWVWFTTPKIFGSASQKISGKSSVCNPATETMSHGDPRLGFGGAQMVVLLIKNPPTNAGDAGSISGSGSSPGLGNSNPLLYSCLENPTDRGAWWATIYGVAKSDTTEQLTHTHKLFIAFLPRSKRCLISWLQSPSAVILEPKKIKSVTVSIVFPSICMK